jgi:5'(3')-deoxyribonucleotidase
MRILLDCDGVIADYIGLILEYVNDSRDVRGVVTELGIVTEYDVEGFTLETCPAFNGEDIEIIHNASECAGFAHAIKPYDGALSFVERLQTLGDITVVTAPYVQSRTWCYDRTKWLEKHFGFNARDIIFTSQKNIIKGNVLIDDNIAHCTSFPEYAVLISRSWNYRHNVNVLTARNYDHAIECVESIKQRNDS